MQAWLRTYVHGAVGPDGMPCFHCTAVQPGGVKGISQYKGLPADTFRQGLIRYRHRRSVSTRGHIAYKTALHSKAGMHEMPTV